MGSEGRTTGVIVVADAGPIHYLVLIEAVDVLHPLYDQVIVPQTVSEELRREGAAGAVREWIKHPPGWCQVQPDVVSDPPLDEVLDPGERAAIAMALSISADRLLIDDWEGRIEAARRQLRVTGTLGVLAEAHQVHLIDFESAVSRLSQTNFYLSENLVNEMRQRLAKRDHS
jgi:predicted nucleic acid-binding protein